MTSPDETTDLANADRYVLEHATKLRFVGQWSRWLAYDGTRWNVNETGVAQELAKATAKGSFAEASTAYKEAIEGFERAMEAGDDELAKVHRERAAAPKRRYAWALESMKRARLDAMVALARSAPELAITHEQLDADPWLLNVANGTLDLRSGVLRPHRREDLVTKLAPVRFDASAECPTWLAFLDHAQAGDEETIAFLARYVGYALTGSVRDHVLMFLYGPGGTGKSTFFNMMHALLGDYAVRAPRKLLFASKGERHETELTTLFGARFVSCNEVDEGARFDEGLVKDLTGGEAITARRMREDHWSFRPTHKLIVGGNHKPVVRTFDDAIRRRLRLVPFVVKPTVEDKRLHDKLCAELPGILAWAVRGCLAWQREGLGEPSAVKAATDEYQSESDPLREFFDLHCVFEAEARTPRAHIRTAYEDFCKENGALPVMAKRFAAGLRARGVTEANVKDMGKTKNGWKGVRLMTEAERDRRGGGYQPDTQIPSDGLNARAPAQDGYRNGGTTEVPTTHREDWTGVCQ